MTKVKPVFITPANPVGLDKLVSELQSTISTASYVDEVAATRLYFDEGLLLPLALKDEITQNPIVYWKDKEYFPAEPNDQYRIVSLFYQEDTASFVSLNDVQYTMNLVVWFNQDKYVRNKNYQIKEYLITELVTLLRSYLRTEDQSTFEVFRELENVYSNYIFTEEQKTRMKYPYQAFRIKFQMSAEFDCGDDAKLDLSL